MSYILGAIDKGTNRYENIVFVEKSRQYKCIGCDSDLILRKGEKKFQSFIHKNKNGCKYFRQPNESQLIHDAMLYLQKLIEDNSVDILRKCEICMNRCNMNIPIYNPSMSVILKEGMDVVYYDENKSILCSFKMYPGIPNKVFEDDRDLPSCYQINMMDLINTCVQNFGTKKTQLVCAKSIVCNECNIKYNTIL